MSIGIIKKYVFKYSFNEQLPVVPEVVEAAACPVLLRGCGGGPFPFLTPRSLAAKVEIPGTFRCRLVAREADQWGGGLRIVARHRYPQFQTPVPIAHIPGRIRCDHSEQE